MVELKVPSLEEFVASGLEARIKAKGLSLEEEVRGRWRPR